MNAEDATMRLERLGEPFEFPPPPADAMAELRRLLPPSCAQATPERVA